MAPAILVSFQYHQIEYKFNIKSSVKECRDMDTGYGLKERICLGSSLGSVANGLQILLPESKEDPSTDLQRGEKKEGLSSGGISALESWTEEIYFWFGGRVSHNPLQITPSYGISERW